MNAVAQTLFNNLSALVVVVNAKGEVEFVSPSVERMLGFEPAQLLGTAWWELTRQSQKESIELKQNAIEMANSFELSVIPPYERVLINSFGEQKHILWNTAKSPDNKLVGIGYDITERKVIERKLQQKNAELEIKNAELLQSIRYAKRLQQAILPSVDIITRHVSDAFVLYQPKDIVSGDLYFICEQDNKLLVAAIDCTGHGVSGALMSVMANNLLKQVIAKVGVNSPAELLQELDVALYESINRGQKEIKSDGMDVALAIFDLQNKSLLFAGAFRPFYLIRNNELTEFSGSKYPVGFYSGVTKTFETINLKLEYNDQLYFFTDGYIDQFGGENDKKFTKKRFKDLLLSAAQMEMDEQESFLEYAFNNWKQNGEQTDDILVIGVKV
ncbi:MAG: SpoIIE family protein phosphatase [Bacteroidota bacterium]